jgi:hypothetical protein
MKPEHFQETRYDIDGWQVNLGSYKFGDIWHCKADNVSPGAWLARTNGTSREEAEQKALERATHLLGRTKRRAV